MFFDHDADATIKQLQQRLTYFFQIKGCRDHSEDLAQETIARALQKLEGGTLQLCAQPTLAFGFAKNVWHEWTRNRGRMLQIDPNLPDSADSGPLADETLMKEEDIRMISICAKRLKPEERQLLYLYDNPSAREKLSEKLGISANTLRQRIFHARAKIGKCMHQKQRATLIRINPATSSGGAI